jgi:hypothetical protein
MNTHAPRGRGLQIDTCMAHMVADAVSIAHAGIHIANDTFQDLGGFPSLPLMDDVELSLRLKE